MSLLRPICIAGLFSLCATGLFAQEETAPTAGSVTAAQSEQRGAGGRLVFPVLVFDRARVLDQSEIGAALEAQVADARAALLAENEKIYADLETEEQEISDAKPTMDTATFQARAQAFDEKVTAVRQSQDEKALEIQKLYDDGLAEIEQQMNTVLAEIARDLGAVVVFERNQVYLMNGAIDISRIAIEKLDEQSSEAADSDQTPEPEEGATAVPPAQE